MGAAGFVFGEDVMIVIDEVYLLSRCVVVESCWEWMGAASGLGHGRINRGGKSVAPYRMMYELKVGPIPDGLVIDHLCRNPRCLNPDHMEPVTSGENVLRGVGPSAMAARQERCCRGHEYTPENVVWLYDGRARGCRECRRMWSRRNLQKKREANAQRRLMMSPEDRAYSEMKSRCGSMQSKRAVS